MHGMRLKLGGPPLTNLHPHMMLAGSNVFEWCSDYYGHYSSVKQFNPQGPSKGSNHVLRGGDFRIDNLNDMKVSTRYFDAPFVNRKGAGLRLVINIENQN